ncbi:MAG TPA: DNA polymerase/3'-5' exonuclease PolX, partial [Armatimonadota bacterium]|nr:DNA polymerase/3'-5' exonuclease PolX [Armatimonadota bacterium]
FLENIADMLEIKGESTFRVRAYRDAARRIESLAEDIQEIVSRGELQEIPGIGESIAAKIVEYLQTGRSTYYDELKKQIKPGIAELLGVPGIGPKKAKLFYDRLGVDSVDKLERAAKEHSLSKIPTIGEKTETNILDSIERMRARSERTPLGIALPTALPFLNRIRGLKEVERADLAGSLRRKRETIGDLDLLAASDEPHTVVDRFVELPMVKNVLGHGPTKGSIVTDENLQVDLRVVKPEEYGAALQYFTGSKAHNIKLRTIAESMGLKLNEYGVFRVSDNKRIAGETEESVYEALGLPCMPPGLREDRGEIEAAREGRLPRLVERSDLKGDLHVHTDWSDGADSPEAVVEAAGKLGYEYIALSDHSVSMGFVHGLTPERIREQRALVNELNRKYRGIRVLHGIEVNIRADGSLDYPDEILANFDVVTASVHSGMGMTRERMTRRIIDAVSNHHVDILGHPSGRIIGKRDPYEVDMDAVLQAAAETNTAMEINSQPDRLDLKDTDARLAKDLGVMLAIDSDAHAVRQLDFVEYGIATARRGWVEPKNVLNALPLNGLLRWLAKRE